MVLDVEAGGAEDKGGYAKAMGEDFYRRQRELLGDVLAEQNVVDHHRRRARQESAGPDHRARWWPHGARIGDRGYRRRARRQLRADAAGRNRGSRRRAHPRAR